MWFTMTCQKCLVCARQKLFACARYFYVILSLYLRNMNLLVDVSSLHHHTTHHCVGFFLTSLCKVFVFRLAFHAFSFSSSVVRPLTQLHPSSLTQLISHNSSHLTTHTTHLAQLNSHNLSHSTYLTQLKTLKSCFRVAFGGAAFVSSHSTSPKFVSIFCSLVHSKARGCLLHAWHLFSCVCLRGVAPSCTMYVCGFPRKYMAESSEVMM